MSWLSELPYDKMIEEMLKPEVKATVLAEESIFLNAPFASVIFNPMNIYPLMSDSPYTLLQRNQNGGGSGGGGSSSSGGSGGNVRSAHAAAQQQGSSGKSVDRSAAPRYERGRKSENFYAVAKARGLQEDPLSLMYVMDASVAGHVGFRL